MENLIAHILDGLSKKNKASILEPGEHPYEDDSDSNGQQLWGYCDGGDTARSKCRGGYLPVDCFTFIYITYGELNCENKFMLCPYCIDEIQRIMQWRFDVAVILKKLSYIYGIPKDIRNLLLDIIFEDELPI